MARLDLGGLRDLWYRIDDIFARLTEAIGSISFSGTTLSWNYASGASAGSVDLNNTFATDAELASRAGHSLGASGMTIILYNGNGSQISSASIATAINSAIDSAVSSGTSGLLSVSTADDRYGASLYYNSSSKQLQLVSRDGTALSTVTLS